MAKVEYYLFIDDIDCDDNHELELSVSVNMEWRSDDDQSLDDMTVCLNANLTEALEAMFLLANEDSDQVDLDQMDRSIHTLQVLEHHVGDLRERLMSQRKRRMEKN